MPIRPNSGEPYYSLLLNNIASIPVRVYVFQDELVICIYQEVICIRECV